MNVRKEIEPAVEKFRDDRHFREDVRFLATAAGGTPSAASRRVTKYILERWGIELSDTDLERLEREVDWSQSDEELLRRVEKDVTY